MHCSSPSPPKSKSVSPCTNASFGRRGSSHAPRPTGGWRLCGLHAAPAVHCDHFGPGGGRFMRQAVPPKSHQAWHCRAIRGSSGSADQMSGVRTARDQRRDKLKLRSLKRRQNASPMFRCPPCPPKRERGWANGPSAAQEASVDAVKTPRLVHEAQKSMETGVRAISHVGVSSFTWTRWSAV